MEQIDENLFLLDIPKFLDWANAWSKTQLIDDVDVFVSRDIPEGDDNIILLGECRPSSDVVILHPMAIALSANSDAVSIASRLIITLGHELRHIDQMADSKLPRPTSHLGDYEGFVIDPAEHDATKFGKLLWEEIPMDILNEVREEYNKAVLFTDT